MVNAPTRYPKNRFRRLLVVGFIASLAPMLAGCGNWVEYVRVYERFPEDEGLSCMEVCESVLTSDEDEELVSCEEVHTLEGDPAVACLFEYYREHTGPIL